MRCSPRMASPSGSTAGAIDNSIAATPAPDRLPGTLLERAEESVRRGRQGRFSARPAANERIRQTQKIIGYSPTDKAVPHDPHELKYNPETQSDTTDFDLQITINLARR